MEKKMDRTGSNDFVIMRPNEIPNLGKGDDISASFI